MTNKVRLSNCATLLAEAVATEQNQHFKGMLNAALILVNKIFDLYAWREENHEGSKVG